MPCAAPDVPAPWCTHRGAPSCVAPPSVSPPPPSLLPLARPAPQLTLPTLANPSADSSTYAAAAALPSSHEATLRVSTALAIAALEVVRSPEVRDEMQREWKKDMTAIGAADALRRIQEAFPEPASKAERGVDGPCGCSHSAA